MSLRKAFFYLVMIALQLALVEGILQGYYRLTTGDWLARRVDLPIFAPDPYRVYRVQSNLDYNHRTNEFSVTYHTDNFGFRAAGSGVETSLDKPPATYRVMFLGPSFSFGTANDYADIFTTLIGAGLVAPEGTIEVINVGTPAQPPRFQLCWLQELGYRFRPDLVVQTVYGDPLLVETQCDLSGELPVVRNGHLYSREPTLLLQIIARAKQSALVFYSWYLYQRLFAPEEMEKGLGTDFYRENLPGADSDADILGHFTAYRDFVAAAAGDQVRTAFLYVPYSYVVHTGDRGRYAHKGVTPPQVLRARAARIARLLAAHDITYIDPTPALVAAAARERMYYFLDVHFTPRGNRVETETALPALQRLIDQ